MDKEIYTAPKFTVPVVTDDLIRTSDEAPDVFTKDPFVQD